MEERMGIVWCRPGNYFFRKLSEGRSVPATERDFEKAGYHERFVCDRCLRRKT